MEIILASASPRRTQILAESEIEHRVIPATLDERTIDIKGLTPALACIAIARAKALNVLENNNKCDCVVLGADTIVVLDGIIIGKPTDRQHAYEILRKLSGRTHQVITGVCLAVQDRIITDKDISYVTFPYLDDEMIYSYIDEYKPYDKAGAYGLQELKGFVKIGLEGAYDNVVGLPMERVKDMVKAMEESNV